MINYEPDAYTPALGIKITGKGEIKSRRRRLGAVTIGAVAADHFDIDGFVIANNSKQDPFSRTLFPHSW